MKVFIAYRTSLLTNATQELGTYDSLPQSIMVAQMQCEYDKKLHGKGYRMKKVADDKYSLTHYHTDKDEYVPVIDYSVKECDMTEEEFNKRKIRSYYFTFIGKENYTSDMYYDKIEAVKAFVAFAESTDKYAWGQLIQKDPTYLVDTPLYEDIQLTLSCPKYNRNNN